MIHGLFFFFLKNDFHFKIRFQFHSETWSHNSKWGRGEPEERLDTGICFYSYSKQIKCANSYGMDSLRHNRQESSLLFLSYSLGSVKKGLVLMFIPPMFSGEPAWLGCVTKSMNLRLCTWFCSRWAVCAHNMVLYCKPDYPVVGQNV